MPEIDMTQKKILTKSLALFLASFIALKKLVCFQSNLFSKQINTDCTVTNLRKARGKFAWQVCGAVFRMDGGGQDTGPGVSYVLQHQQILDTLFKG